MNRLSALLFTVAIAIGLQASAQGLGEIKQRMKARLAKVEALKIAKTVGEDKNGYLHVLGEVDADGKATIEAENADRKLVYKAIAAKTGATAETVGQRRAKTIAKGAAAGVMLQAPDGTWYEKK